jgi:hypothetical protein
MKKAIPVIAALILASVPLIGTADPSPGKTTVLGPFTGVGAKLHPKNMSPQPVRYYGTDLGWSYEHAGQIHFIFGDTAATEKGELIEASSKGVYDDAFGTISLAEWPDPTRITPTNVPPIYLGQNPGTTEVSAINPGHALESFKTPVAGFSNGTDQFGIFYTGKPQGCRVDADCSNTLACDTGIGFVGERPDTDKGATFGCLDGTQACTADTLLDAAGKPVANTGFCTDSKSSAWADTDVGRVSGLGFKNLVSVRSTEDPRRYRTIHEWRTNRFSNVAVRTVNDFDPARAADKQGYQVAKGAGDRQRVFLWGRPGFIGVSARGRPLALYFGYADMPRAPDFQWKVRYYTGTNDKGMAQFSDAEIEAQPADLDSSQPGVQSAERYDVVNQVSISWVEPLRKWVMLYGGGVTRIPGPTLARCGVLELFTRAECTEVVIGNGAFRMRTADHPWGPWTPPQDVLVGGDPEKSPPELQYAPGGMLRHADCKQSNCAPATNWEGVNPREYGFFYAANIIEQWTRPAGEGADIIWNASTWNPYRVILLRTHINP